MLDNETAWTMRAFQYFRKYAFVESKDFVF